MSSASPPSDEGRIDTTRLQRLARAYTETAVVNDPTATSAEIGDLDPGTWYFAVTAFDDADNHSELSAEVSKVVTQ